MSKGFTLIELVVVLGIMAILGTIMTNFLVQTVRGENKSKLVNQVKQNGQVVLDTISSQIRNSEQVICIGNIASGSLTLHPFDNIVLYGNGVYTQIVLNLPTATTNGDIDETTFIGPVDSSACTVAHNTIALNGVINLSDNDPINGISLDFTTQSGVKQDIFSYNANGAAQVVTIQFSGFSGVNSGSSYDLLLPGGVPFQTSIEIRGQTGV